MGNLAPKGPTQKPPKSIFDGRLGWALWHGFERALQNQDPHLWVGGDGKIATMDEAAEATEAALSQADSDRAAARSIFLQIAEKVEVSVATVKDSLSLQGLLFLNSPYRNHWLSAGIGTGKSYLGARYALKRAITNWETVGVYAANSYQQLSQSSLPHLFTLLKQSRLKYVVDRKPPASWGSRDLFQKDYENIISIRIGKNKVAHILTRTLENWKVIRGVTIGWAVIDEIADTRFEAWEEINERLRCELSHALEIRVLGMPALPGDNWTWEEFSNGDPTLYRVTFQASTEAMHLSYEKYLRPLLRRLDPLKALQRIFARIVIDQSGRAYRSYRDGINNVKKYKYDPWAPLYLTSDFNILSASNLEGCAVQLFDNGNKEYDVQVLDEFSLPNADTRQLCETFLERECDGLKFGEHKGELHFYGDASGGHSQTVSEYKIARDILGQVFRGRLMIPTITHNPLIIERINAVNGLLRPTIGAPRLFIDPKCERVIQDMRKVVPGKQEGTIDKSDSALTHVTDALGYLLRWLFPPWDEEVEQSQIKAHY